MKIERLQRIMQLVAILQTQRSATPENLSRQLKVSRRTIFRDLDMLRKAGIPCSYNDEKQSYSIDQSFFLPPLHLNLQEALALLLSVGHTNKGNILPLTQPADQAAIKIESILPHYIRQQCQDVLKNTTVKMAAQARHDKKEDTFALLQRAIRSKHKVKITYKSFYEQDIITTTLSPYHLYFGQRAWYVIGYSSCHQETRTFKISRMLICELLDKLYLLNKPFNIDKHFGYAWSMIPEGKMYHVKLLFSKKVASNVAEVLWHQTQRLGRLKDRTLHFEVDVDGLSEIQWWVASYGDQVKVLSPTRLRNTMMTMAQNITRQYQRVS